PCGTGLVQLWLGDSIAGNRLSGHFPLSPGRWPAFSKATATPSRDLAVPLADFSHHARRRSDQTARGSVLARSHLPLLPLRNSTHTESSELVAAFPPALVSQARSPLEPRR